MRPKGWPFGMGTTVVVALAGTTLAASMIASVGGGEKAVRSETSEPSRLAPMPGWEVTPATAATSGENPASGTVAGAVVDMIVAGESVDTESKPAPISLDRVLSTHADGYERAYAPRDFLFPRDHGPHPDFQTEWWYFTGNLHTEDAQNHFGFQLTIFRFALAPAPASTPTNGGLRSSKWATRQAYMAHFALSDTRAGRHAAFEHFERGALGLAGAQATPFRVWVADWEIATGGRKPGKSSDGGWWPLRVTAQRDGYGIDLEMNPGLGPVFPGERGLSRRSAASGNASYYYSFPRLPVRGVVTTPAGSYRVTGEAWFDREWSTGALGRDQVGWDWFALQLEDGRALMYYQLRRHDGTADPYSAGIVVESDGSTSVINAKDLSLEVLDTWISESSGASYPARWRLSIPKHELDLLVRPRFAAQELNFAFRYWEGAVVAESPWRHDAPSGAGTGGQGGTGESAQLGQGYVELTGY